MKKGGVILLICILMINIFSVGVYAQDETDVTVDSGVSDDSVGDEVYDEEKAKYEQDYQEKFEEYEGPIEFDAKAGTTPDSALYFIDDFFERTFVGDNPGRALNYKEEKIAEAIIMVEKGMPEEAERVLEKALEYNDIIEEEVTPELEKRVEESSMQVQYVLKEIEEQVSGDEWKGVIDKVDDNFKKEGKLRTAAEIAAKINELCAELAELDPIQYEDTCKTDSDGPKWMRDRDREWTKEQEKEAKEFGKIMEECMKTSGRDCRCEDIPFYEFSTFCEKMSSLAVNCDEGDENACMEMEGVEMPELPEHLEDVYYDIEREFGEAKFENHMPLECIDAGVTSPKECMLIMIEFNAPPECRIALKEAAEKGEIKGERDGKKLCDEIMFREHTPQECIDAGATTPDECAKIMFGQGMPPKCIAAGFDGTHQGDERECKEMMKRGDHYGGGGCMGIGTIEERLTCLEGAMMGMGDRYGNEDVRREITWQCQENRIFNPADCDRFMMDEWPKMEQQRTVDTQRTVEQRQVYKDYRVQGGQLCPDGDCDYAEQNGMAYCPQDCGDIYGGREQCGYNCWWEVDHCECKNQVSGMDCGYGCWWDSGLKRCECQNTGQTQCGYNCWWVDEYTGGYCKCGTVDPAYKDCGYGCWWEPSMNACKCSPTSAIPSGDCGQGCWWEYDHCECGSGGCQCSWGWSDTCDCGTSTGCTNWATTGQGCNPSTGTCCSSGMCSNMYGPGSCVDSTTGTTCVDGVYSTSAGACDYAMCPSGCTFNYQGCPDGCMSVGTDPCPADACPNVCCGTTTTCVDGVYSTSAGACDYAMCPSGCTFNYQGCPDGCMTTGGTTCSSMGGTCCTACSSAGPYIPGTECNCCGSCESTTSGGCTIGSCGTGYYCGASGICMPEATTGCTCADGYWSDVCDCTGHETPVPTGDVCASCDCSVCGTGDCIGTDGMVCCTAPVCESPPTGGVFWDYYYN